MNGGIGGRVGLGFHGIRTTAGKRGEPVMADIVLTIDPDDTSFALHDRTNGRRLMGFDAPVPETDSQWAFSADTEGERRANLRYRNRMITAEVLLDRSTAALLEALENTLGQKVGKLAREGGELRFTYPTGTTITFNVLEASMNRVFDIADMAKFRARYEISFICEPFGSRDRSRHGR